ncbi:MAG: isoaspartyl peptidase/L-asparaginase, partial [Nitrososphaerales archaeon]|nr:isoaspartyl peptidase/L-asparaginase [Nitrososphaerales archaeon]
MKPNIIVHGGAGSGKFGSSDVRFRELKNAVEAGMNTVGHGSALDAVVAAVATMEESGVFNAGRGAYLTADGRVQLDAAVMTGNGLRGAGVGAVESTFKAVSLARWVMENTSHVLMVGEETAAMARAANLPVEQLKPTESVARKFEEALSGAGGKVNQSLALMRRLQEGNTVGAVAIDNEGVPAAAVSTGGLWLKLPGRVGDSAILGAGIYADAKSGASCATGTGEEIIRNVLSWRACEYLKRESASSAARKAIAAMTRSGGPGSAGLITVDKKGRVGFAYNTEAMGRAWYD